MPRVSPTVLKWARETAGLSLGEAARKLQINAAYGHSGEERLARLELGEGEIARPLLLRLAKQYRRPLLTFYLENPPLRGDRGSDFRTAHGAMRTPATEGLLDALVRDIRARQGIVRDLLDDDEDTRPLSFVASASMDMGTAAFAERLRNAIRFNLAEYRRQPNVDTAFAWLRRRAEDVGFYVLLLGNLGSFHTNLDVQTFRGFAVADPIAPFVVINDQDAKPAWSFTLLHEIAHVLLGQTGVSGAGGEAAIERFCNEVASQILVPDVELSAFERDGAEGTDHLAALIQRFASARNVSATMVAYRLKGSDIISLAEWTALRDFFLTQWRRGEDARRARDRDKDGPSFYVVRRHRLGAALASLVRRSLDGGTLTPTRAAKVLGVKPRSVYPLLGMDAQDESAAA